MTQPNASVLEMQEASFDWRGFFARNWQVSIAFLVLALPSVWILANSLWQTDDQAHGPIVLLVVLWLFWGMRDDLMTLPNKGSKLGWPVFLLGLLCYIVGMSQSIYIVGIGSFILLLAGMILLTLGWAGLKRASFPIFFLLFLIPLPGVVVDTVTSTLKQQVSVLAESILYAAGLPIARTGVTLTIGPYELLVADACSGMNSMFSLFALGVLYLYLQGYASKIRNLILFSAIAPIAFFANIVRVIILVLITYQYGDEAGQGFIHGFAGVVLFTVALLALFLLDKLLPASLISRKGRVRA